MFNFNLNSNIKFFMKKKNLGFLKTKIKNMSIKILNLNETDKLQALFEEKKTFFIYCYGSYNEKTGSSWCSDCNLTKPIIEEQIKKLNNNENENGLFVKLPIETKQEWSNKKHWTV